MKRLTLTDAPMFKPWVHVPEAAERLKAYEDTVLQPEEVQTLADAKRDGRLIMLPCKIGTHLWRVTYPYRQSPKVTEYIVRNFRTITKKNKLQIEVKAINVPVSNWMYYNDFYTTREEAEAALEVQKGENP